MSRRRGSGDSPSRHQEDAELVARCLEGDEKAWNEILKRHRALILAVGLRNGLRGDQAEDLYQATCVTLLRRLELLRDHQSLAAWVATTAARKAWRMKARGRAETELAPDLPSDSSPHREFAAATRQQAVAGALERMAEPCRGLLKALFVEEVPYEVIAQRLGLSVGSIGVYRRRCLDRLRREMETAGWRDEAGDE